MCVTSIGRLGLVMLTVFVWLAPAAHAQDADALSLIVDQRGQIYRLNFLCTAPDCTSATERITSRLVKQGAEVAIGSIGAQNFAFIGNQGNASEVLMLIEPEPDSLNWTPVAFSNRGASALVVTSNDDVLYLARPASANIERYSHGSGNAQTLGFPTQASGLVGPVKVGGKNCQNIVGLEEYPAGSGDLIAVCAKPAGAVWIGNPAPQNPPAPTTFTAIAGSGIAGIVGAAVTTVPLTTIPPGPPPQQPTVVGQRDYLLLVVGSNEVMALDLRTGTRQRNLFNGSGSVRSIATGLCNFPDPDNDVDTDLDVDGPCAVIAQSGSEGLATIFEIEASPGSTSLFATVRDGIVEDLDNPFGIDFDNTHTVRLADCFAETSPEGCRIANNQVTLYWDDVADGAFASFETQGPFVDPRYNPSTGVCDRDADGQSTPVRVELPLAFTNIPVLEHAMVGPEFCARDGAFFVDIVTAPDITPASGFTQYETPGDCWMPGAGSLGNLPALDLDEVEYGLLFGDEFDLFRTDGTNSLPTGTMPTADYANNFYAQDHLIGCATRVRSGGALTFVIEDFEGNRLMGDIGSPNTAIDDNVLYQYGLREAHERINIPVNATQSGCHEELLADGHLSGACAEHVVALNGGLAGWALQRQVGQSAIITGAAVESASSGAVAEFANLIPGSGLTGRLSASGGQLSFRNAGTRVVGVSGLNATELDVGENLRLVVSTAPRPDDAVLPDGSSAVPVSVDVPFVLSRLTLALLFDGPEFGDVQEVARLVATTDDDTLTATLVNPWETNGATDSFLWQVTSANGHDVSDLQSLDWLVLSGDNTELDFATVRLNSPFGNRAILSLDITALPGTPAASCPSCSNPSDFSVAEIGVGMPDRIGALAFAYRNYLEALCPVSTRPDASATLGTRPQLCDSGPDTDAFNVVTTAVPPGGIPEPRNLAGHQQADIEAVLRFIAHNICELDFDTTVNPAGTVLGPDGFCGTRPEWSAPATP